MTPQEFKSWFDGFTEAFGDSNVPTQKQWARIKDRVNEIDGRAVTERVFIDRYNPWKTYPPYITFIGNTLNDGHTVQCNNAAAQGAAQSWQGLASIAQNTVSASGSTFDSHTAMYALGRTDADSVS